MRSWISCKRLASFLSDSATPSSDLTFSQLLSGVLRTRVSICTTTGANPYYHKDIFLPIEFVEKLTFFHIPHITKIFFTCFNINIMKISNIQTTNFRNTQQTQPKKREFIDKISEAVQNQRDVNDCVAVPRGIFKAYLFIMAGFAMIGIAGVLPQKLKYTKMTLGILGNLSNLVSAFYFAKPFAFKGVSPTVKREDVNN